jgi:hypothetical protein
MKIASVVAALAFGVLGATFTSPVAADEDYVTKVKVEAKRADGKLGLKLASVDGWYINKDFPIKCTLKIAEGGKLEKEELKKDDAKFEDAGKEGKAKSVSFSVAADKAVTGECKLVVCSESACSAPFKVPVKAD